MKSLLQKTIVDIKPPEPSVRAAARRRLESLTMPHWALGRLMDAAEDLAGMSGSLTPRVSRKTIVTMAADHGVCAEGVSLYPQEVTHQMVHNFVGGGAGINVLARLAGARVIVVDMGVAHDFAALEREGKIISKKIAYGTSNMAKGPAMSREQALASVEAGIQIAEKFSNETDVFGTGDMGIGNTTASAAVASVMLGRPVEEIAGRGTGLNDAQLQHKIKVIKSSLQINQPDRQDPLDVLAKVGGFEIGGIAGLILGAARARKPIVIDGFISTAGALIAKCLAPSSLSYALAAHKSEEKGHAAMLEFLNMKPLLDLNLRLGEGTGAALAMNLVEAAVRILTEVSTFEEASVSTASN